MSQLLSEKFKYLIDYKSGYTWSKDQENIKKEDGSIRVLTVTNVQKTLDLRSELYLTKVSENDKIEKAVSKDWTIAVSSNGNRSRIGNAIFVENDCEYLFASFLTAFKPKVDFLDPKYFYYWFSSDYVQQSISSVAEGSTGLSNLDIRYLRNMDIKYHNSSDEQKAIATILSKVDEAIETTKQTINSAQKLKTSLMQNLLTGKIKPDGTKRKDDEFYYDEKLGKVPKGWDIESLNKLFNINEESLSTNTEPEFTFKYISIEMVDTEKINYEKCPIYNFKDAPGRARRVVKDNDILISGVRPNLKSFAIYNKPDSDNWIVTTGIYVLSAKKDVCSNYFFYQILSEIAEKQFHSYVAGTNYPAIGDRDLKRLKLLVPCYTEQKEISEKFKEVSELIKVKEIKLNKLEKLKKSLMQNLLTGKMRLDEKLIKELISHV